MTRQQFADELLVHWRLLWPLAPAERMKKINEIAADLKFEEELRGVKEAMAEPNVIDLAEYRAKRAKWSDSFIREMLDDLFDAAIHAIGMAIFVSAAFILFMVLA